MVLIATDGAVPEQLKAVIGKPRLFLLNGWKIEGIRSLSEPEVRRYEEAKSRLGGARQGDLILYMSEENWEEFVDSVQVVLSSASGDETELNETEALAVNRRLSNYLASMRFYLDFEEKRIKRIYGNDSQEAAEFKRICSEAYDESFAYRFASRLRNFVLHHGPPVGRILDSQRLNEESGEPTREIQILFAVDELLLERKTVWRSLATELEARGPDLDILEALSGLAEKMREVRDVVRARELPGLTNAAEAILTVYGDTVHREGTPSVGRWVDEDGRLAADLDESLIPLMRLVGVS
jgi:hypothetical protein